MVGVFISFKFIKVHFLSAFTGPGLLHYLKREFLLSLFDLTQFIPASVYIGLPVWSAEKWSQPFTTYTFQC